MIDHKYTHTHTHTHTHKQKEGSGEIEISCEIPPREFSVGLVLVLGYVLFFLITIIIVSIYIFWKQETQSNINPYTKDQQILQKSEFNYKPMPETVSQQVFFLFFCFFLIFFICFVTFLK